MVSQARGRSAQNPVMFLNADGVVNLLHTSQEAFQGQGTSEVRRLRSTDGGMTWHKPKTLFKTPGRGLHSLTSELDLRTFGTHRSR